MNTASYTFTGMMNPVHCVETWLFYNGVKIHRESFDNVAAAVKDKQMPEKGLLIESIHDINTLCRMGGFKLRIDSNADGLIATVSIVNHQLNTYVNAMTTQVLTHDEVTLLAPAGNFVSTDTLTQLIRDVEAAVLRKVSEPKSKMERTDAFNWQTLVEAMRKYGKLAINQGTFDDVLQVFTEQRNSVLKQRSELQRIKAALGGRNDLDVEQCIAVIKSLENQATEARRIEGLEFTNRAWEKWADDIREASAMRPTTPLDRVTAKVKTLKHRAKGFDDVVTSIDVHDPDCDFGDDGTVLNWIADLWASREQAVAKLDALNGTQPANAEGEWAHAKLHLHTLYDAIGQAMQRLEHLPSTTNQFDAAVQWIDSIRPAMPAEEKNMFALTHIDCMVLEAGLSDSKLPPFPFRARLLSAQMNANGSVKQARFRYKDGEISLQWPTIILGMDAKL